MRSIDRFEMCSQNRFLQSALFSSHYHADRSCCPIPHWSPRPIQLVVDNESRSRSSAVEQFYFELLFFFLRTVIGYHLGCMVYVLGAIASVLNVGILWPGADVRRHFFRTWSGMKRPRMRRIPAFALAALCIAAAPLCAKSHVCS
jgi:hypothetical protein